MVEPLTWTEADDEWLMALRADGLTHMQIAREMGRTESSIQKRHSRLTGMCAVTFATIRLGDLMVDAQIRYANAHGLNLEDAQTELMGGTTRKVIPGTETYLKTASAERARV